MAVLFFGIASLVALEFGLHIAYHVATGKAGIDEPAFAYLKHIADWLKREIGI